MADLIRRLRDPGNPKVRELARLPLFEDLPRRRLTALATYLDEVEMAPGRTLTRESRGNDTFWILLEGEAEMSVAGATTHVLGPGDFFGETSMLAGRGPVATVRTRTPIRALVAGREQFRALEGDDRIAFRLLATALRRMREELELGRRPAQAA